MQSNDAHWALWSYTLSHGGHEFVHQHVVDAWAAQHADATTKPIQLTFALIGLYLHVERGYDGRRVQRVHRTLANARPRWPTLPLPAHRGSITADDVMAAQPGPKRDAAIDAWCASVWSAYGESREAILGFLRDHA